MGIHPIWAMARWPTDGDVVVVGRRGAQPCSGRPGSPDPGHGLRGRRVVGAGARAQGAPGGHPKAPTETTRRPEHTPPGPIEAYADGAFLASLGGSALTLATTGSVLRTTAMPQAGLPAAAHYGRGGFAAHLGRILVSRGRLHRMRSTNDH